LTTNDEGLLTIQTNSGNIKAKAEEQRQRLVEVANHEGFDVNKFFSEMDHPWLCHQRLFDQIDVTLQRIGREESHYDQQQSRQGAQEAANRMRNVYDTCINALTNWLNGEELDTSLQKNPETATILANTYDVLGEWTPVKVWLASAFRKKMALFREDDLEYALAV
jgi:HSP90 family molecular chaperone